MPATYELVCEGAPALRCRLGERDVLIGRAESADFRLDGTAVSRVHARVRRHGDAVEIQDLGSQNGTHVNGRRVDGPTTLAPGDRLQLGAVVLRLERLAEPGEPPAPKVSFTFDRQSGGEIWNVGGDVHQSTTVTEDDPWDELFHGAGAGRLLMAVGLIAVVAGFGMWMAFIFTGFSPPSGVDPFEWNPFTDGARVLGLPQPVVGFILFAGGGLVASMGSGLSRAARRRRGDDVHPVRSHATRRRS